MKFTAFVLATAAVSASAQQFVNNPFNQGAFQPYMVQQPYLIQQPQIVDPLAWERDCTWINSVNFRSLLSLATCGTWECSGVAGAVGPNGNGGGHSKVATIATPVAGGYHVWGSVVNRAGRVCAVSYTGADLTMQFPYGRILSMKLANTANSLSLPARAQPSHVRHSYPNNNRGLIMSGSGNAQYAQIGGLRHNSDIELDERDTAQFSVAQFGAANLPNSRGNALNTADNRVVHPNAVPPAAGLVSGFFAESQWFGFTLPAEQFNPGNVDVHYQGAVSNYGQACGTNRQDSMCMQKPGGFTYQAGGLPLYDAQGVIRGAIGVAGDNDCTNHAIAWKTRQQLQMHYTPCIVTDNRNDLPATCTVATIAGLCTQAVITQSININVLWAGKRAEDNVIFSQREQYLFPACQDIIRQFPARNPTATSTFSAGCSKA